MTLMIAFSAAMLVLGVDVGLFRMAHDLFHELPNSRTAETEGMVYFPHRLSGNNLFFSGFDRPQTGL